MTHDEATRHADRLNQSGGVAAKVVRILADNIDPPTDGDNGWDVEVTNLEVTGD